MRDTYYESLIVNYDTEQVVATRTDMGTSTAMRWIQAELRFREGNLQGICHEWVYNDLVGEPVIHRTAHVNLGDQQFNFEQVTR